MACRTWRSCQNSAEDLGRRSPGSRHRQRRQQGWSHRGVTGGTERRAPLVPSREKKHQPLLAPKGTPGPSRRPMAQPPCCPWPSPARCGQPDQAKLESSAPRPPNEWAPQPLAELSCWRREQRSAPAASASSPRMLVLAPARCRVPPADTRPKGRGSSARPPAQQLRSKAQITPCFCQTLIFFPLLRQ